MSRQRCSSPALSSVDGSDDDNDRVVMRGGPPPHAGQEQDIAIRTLSALRATLGAAAVEPRTERSPDLAHAMYHVVDDDDDDDVARLHHAAGRYQQQADPAGSIWGEARDGDHRVTPPDSTPGGAEPAIENVALAFEKDDPNIPPYVVAVQALDPRTTTRSLFETFFPMGCSRAVVYTNDEDVAAIQHTTALVVMRKQRMAQGTDDEDPIPVPYPTASGGRRKIAGLVYFKTEETARFAAFKMHDFVPHGQSNPLHACFASGKLFAEAYREFAAEPELCFVRGAAVYGHGSSVSAPASHNTSLNTSDATLSGPRRLAQVAHSLFGTVQPPLTAMSAANVRFALALTELDCAGPRVSGADVDGLAERLLESVTNEADPDESGDLVQLLLCGVSANHRNVLRTVDAFLRKAAQLTNDAHVGSTVAALVQVPFARAALHGLLFGRDRAIRYGNAAVVASLLDANLLEGPGFGICIKLFNSKVVGQPSSVTRDLTADAIICLASCIKSAQRAGASSHGGVDLLGGGVLFPAPRDGPKLEGQERDFVAMVLRHREEVANEPPRTPPHSFTAGVNAIATPEALPLRNRTPTTNDVQEYSGSSNGDTTPRYGGAGRASGSSSSQPHRSVIASAGGLVGVPPARYAEIATTLPPSTLNADILPCTVYITRVPRTISDTKLRGILATYGELTKVRVYESGTKRAPGGEKDDSSFCFVEYRTPTGARNLVAAMDRAVLHLVGPSWEAATWYVCPHGTAPPFSPDTEPLVSAVLRCSPARSSIHDHDPRDAVYDARCKVRECLFGICGRTAATGGAPSAPGSSATNGPVGFTTRPTPTRPIPSSVSPAAVVASFSQAPSPARPGLNASAAPWGGAAVREVDDAPSPSSSADSSFVVSSDRR